MWGLIVSAFAWIGGVLGSAATAIATAAWSAIVAIWNVLKETGHVISLFGRHVWSFLGDAWGHVIKPAFEGLGKGIWKFLKDTWDRVLKPAWKKFNRWVDKAHEWLKAKFGPILCWLAKARKFIDTIYKTYVRPWLDLIDVARAFLRILSTFGIEWAKKLDAKLGAIESWVRDQFAYVRRRINEAIDLIDRIIDIDGLYQRVTLLRSLARDAEAQIRILTNTRLKPLTDEQRQETRDAQKGKKLADVQADLHQWFDSGSGAEAAVISEMALIWVAHFSAR